MTFPKFLKIAVQGTRQIIKINESTFIQKMVPIEFDATLSDTIAKVLGFSYKLVYPSDGEYGRRLFNDSWTGLLGLLQTREADMAISLLAESEERCQDFHCSYPYTVSDVTFITRKHGHSTDINVFLNPFSTKVWLAVIACVCTMPFIFRFLMSNRCSPVGLTASMLLRQSVQYQPRKVSEYLLLAFWFFGITLLGYFYSAVLLSFVTVPSLDGIRTVKDLAKEIQNGQYQCFSSPGSFYRSTFLQSEDPSIQVIGRSLQEGEESKDFSTILETFSSKKPAYVNPRVILIPYKDIYFVSEDNFFSGLGAIPVRKDFCCKVKLDRFVSSLWEAGMINKIYKDSFYKDFFKNVWKSSYRYAEGQSKAKLTMAVFKGPFLFLIVAHLLATLVFLTELCVSRLKCA